jgi:hypothetical protein
MVRDGRVGVNSDTRLPPHAPAGNGSSAGYNQSGAAARMLSVGADWGADVGVVPAAANSGALRLRARGGSAPLTLVLTLADPPTDFLWQTLPAPSSSPAPSPQQLPLALGLWLPLTAGVEVQFELASSGTYAGGTYAAGESWEVSVMPISPLRVRGAAGDKTFEVEAGGTFHTASNLTAGEHWLFVPLFCEGV